MNQYKLLVLIFLSILSFKSSFTLFLNTVIKITDCFAKTTSWFSGITLKTVLKLPELISTSLILHCLSIYLQRLRKSFINNSPLLFKTYISYTTDIESVEFLYWFYISIRTVIKKSCRTVIQSLFCTSVSYL